MPSSPLYKFLSAEGARLTLGNRTFKHAKPSDFNDVEDLTIQSIFPEETEAALKKLTNSFTEVILQHLYDAPTCNSPMKEKVTLIQQVLQATPEAADVIRAELAKEGGEPIYDVEHTRKKSAAFVEEINDFLQGYRILCVTTLIDSDKIWVEYAENHRGIALRIEPDLNKDSKFRLFRPVLYREKRPPLYEDSLEFIAGPLFGDQELRLKTILEKIIYTKTLAWEHESEYRLAIPLRKGEKPWDTLSYHPEEITEIYLGLAMKEKQLDEILNMARAINPDIVAFKAKRTDDGRLNFIPVSTAVRLISE